MNTFCKITKICIYATSLAVGTVFVSACSNQDFYEKEMYKSVLYMLSEGNQNVYTIVLPFKETPPTQAFFSIGCGGSLPNEEEVVVELETDTVLYDQFNRLNFVVDTPSFARILPESRYHLSSYTVRFPANLSDQYVKVPIEVDHHGLSPDSIYLIPLNIKSVSRYELNEEKRNALIRIAVENDYAEQINATYYILRGTKITGTSSTSISGSKVAAPISATDVRFYAGDIVQSDEVTLAEIQENTIVATINSDSTVSVRPYGTLEVEQVNVENYNRYYTQPGSDGKPVQYIDVAYRYRKPGQTAWTEIRESLERSN